MTKVKVLLRVKQPDANGRESVRCEVKMNADMGIINIVGEIGWWDNNTSQRFAAALDTMKQAGIKKLKGYINSPGGNVFDANEIYNQIISFCAENDRFLEIGALCASAGTTIAMAFPTKNTRAYNNVTWMMHNPTIGIDGEEKDLLSGVSLLKNLKDGYVKRYANRMGISETTLRNKMDGTWWMTGEDLIKYNIISGFLDGEDKLPIDTKQVFNRLQVKKLPDVLNSAIESAEKKPAPTQVEEGIEEEQPNENQTLKNTMKNFLLILMTSVVALKDKLTENASDAEAVAAINKAFSEKDAKIAELTNSLKTHEEKVKELTTKVENHTKDMIKALLDVAQNTEKKITAEQRKVYEEQAPILGYDGLSKILNSLTPRQSIKNNLGGESPERKEGDQESRQEPTFFKSENGERIYTKPGNQAAVLARMLANQNK